MYFGKLDVEAAIQFLNGCQLAVDVLFAPAPTLPEQVVKARGWQWSARHPSQEMRGRGMSPEAIIDGLLAIEIEVLRRLAEGMP
jgi:hypothetical protein